MYHVSESVHDIVASYFFYIELVYDPAFEEDSFAGWVTHDGNPSYIFHPRLMSSPFRAKIGGTAKI